MPSPRQTQTPVPSLPVEWLQAAADSLADAVAARIKPAAPPTPTESTYLSVPEAAEFLRCRPQRVYDLLSRRRLARYRDGSRVLLSRSELERYLEADVIEAR